MEKQTKENTDVLENDGVTATETETEKVVDFEKMYNDTNDKYIRLYADFENFKKRNATEYSNLLKTASKEVITSMIPILDDFERALSNVSDEESKKGIELIYNKMKDTLSTKGLLSYSSVGEEFNADLHDCITQVPNPENVGKVIAEVEKGYKLNGLIIRHSKVVVGC